jgi:hypothetical protein
MAAVRPAAALLALALAALPLSAAAAPFAVRLGLERVVVDSPSGFSDTTDLASPRLQDFADLFISASERVLLLALTDADRRKFMLGDKLDARQFAMVATPKVLEQQRVTREQFAGLAADAQGALGKPAQFTDLVKYMESQPIGKTSLIGELRNEPNVLSLMQATRLPPLPGTTFWEANKPQYLVFSTTLLFLNGKALRLSLYTLGETMPDLEWIRSNTRRWTDELQRLNPR